MTGLIKYYLYSLPILALIGIILSVFRTAYQDSYVESYLLFTTSLDLIVILIGNKYLKQKNVIFVVLLLFLSLLIGLLNNDLSRRFITDFTNPFFFFGKLYIFKDYWRTNNFQSYLKYYTKIATVGSILLLPVTYYLFNATGATRLAIFPPMEVPFSYFLQSGGFLLLLSFIIITLYGKRAQLGAAIFVLILNTLYLKRNQFFKYVFISTIIVIIGMFVLNAYGDNLAVRRLNSTIENFNSSESSTEGLSNISSGRDEEIELVISKLEGLDYIFGRGLGVEYKIDRKDQKIGNVHFSPLSFLMKYGIVFTMFIYYFLLSNLFRKGSKIKSFDKYYLSALGTSFFIFIESFFAYALFVSPIFVVMFGYILHMNSVLPNNKSSQ